MNFKQLQRLLNNALINFKESSTNTRLDGMERDLDHREIVALAYYKAVLQHFINIGAIKDMPEYDVVLLNLDSNVPESDYE